MFGEKEKAFSKVYAMQYLTTKTLILLLLAPCVYAQPPWAWRTPWQQSTPGPQLGVHVEELSFRRLDTLAVPYGVLVTGVMPRSPAEAGGLRVGDILLELDNQAIFSVARLRWLLDKAGPNQTIALKYHRASESLTAQIGLRETMAPPDMQSEWGWISPSYLGASLQALTEGLREAFSVPGDVGVLVTEVFENSPGQRAGLRAGDVIVKMNRRPIHTIDDVQRVLNYLGPGEQMDVEIIRDKKSEQLKVTLGERRGPNIFGRWQDWMEPYQGQLPFFADPDWWHGMDEFMRHWRQYLGKERNWKPPRAL